MPKNTLQDLQNHLFAQLEALGDNEATPATIDRANAAANVSRAIIESAKVQIKYEQLVGDAGIINSAEPSGLFRAPAQIGDKPHVLKRLRQAS